MKIVCNKKAVKFLFDRFHYEAKKAYLLSNTFVTNSAASFNKIAE